MILVEQHQIKKSDPRYEELDSLMFLSKNLYNASLYEVRQHYFNTKKFLGAFTLINKFVAESQPDYVAMPRKVSQQTVMMVQQNFQSFFKALQSKSCKARIPKYLKKDGRYCAIFTKQALSKKAWLKRSEAQLSGTKVSVKTKVSYEQVCQVRVLPRANDILLEVVYEVPDVKEQGGNGRYAAIDLGVNNLATVSSNVVKPFILNGRPLKSINQYYNKKRAELSSALGEKRGSHRLTRLHRKRNNKIKDYLHKASRLIVNHLVSQNISMLAVGKNVDWKQETNLGKRNNQNFVSIPHSTFVDMLRYKCELTGIKFVLHEESYTSRCSFLDNEPIGKHEVYSGERVKRGLFKSANGRFINADLNGSLNILRKVVGDFQYPIEACSTPSVKTIKFE